MNDKLKPKEVAVGVILNPKGEILFAQRPENKMFAGWWELPGGKIELGESPKDALIRELQEELGITSTDVVPWITFTHAYASGPIRLHFFRVYQWEGTPQGLENQRIVWSKLTAVTPEDIHAAIEERLKKLSKLEETTDLVGTSAAQQVLSIEESIGLTLDPYLNPVLPATLPALKWLQLPDQYAITQIESADNIDAFLKKLDQALASGIKMVQFRELAWSRQQGADQQKNLYEAFQKVLKRVRAADAKLLVNSVHPSDWWAEADGVHLQSDIADLLGRPKLAPDALVGVSTHNPAQLVMARRIKADFAILGNVLSTSSHPDRSPIGWEQFAKWVQDAGLPVYALGGMDKSHLKSAQQMGAHGIAGIRQFW